MALIKDISGICGVSKSTVSKALRGYPDVGEETRQMILRTARELDLHAEKRSREAVSDDEVIRLANNIGILLPDAGSRLDEPYYRAIMHGICKAAQENDCDISIMVDNGEGPRDMGYLARILYRKMDGVCVMCSENELYDRKMVELLRSDVPTVLIGHNAEGVASVQTDRRESMQMLVDYLHRMGHKRIGLIRGDGSRRLQLESFFLASAALAGIKGRNCRISVCRKRENVQSTDSGILAMQMIEGENPPTCIVFDSMERGMAAALYLHKKNVRIPEDISLAVFSLTDEQMPENIRTGYQWGDFLGGFMRLTAVVEHPEIIGYEAGRKIISMARNRAVSGKREMNLKENLRLTGEMIVGDTVAALN